MMTIDEIKNQVYEGDCLEILKDVPDATFTAIVTDPPYGLDSKQTDIKKVLSGWLSGGEVKVNDKDFMGKDWQLPGPKVWEEIMRVLKPGGHIFSFYGTRTYDLGVMAMRLAGAEVRDKLDFFCEIENSFDWVQGQGFPKSRNISKDLENDGHTSDAKKWEGYGSALKPAHEPVAMFTKSGGASNLVSSTPFLYTAKVSTKERNYGCENLFWLTDGESMKLIDEEEYKKLMEENEKRKDEQDFVAYKLSKGNPHPTVKPIELMRYLVRMVKMPGDNLILDPFCGSGSTLCACALEGMDFVGIDKDSMSATIAVTRAHYFRCFGEKGLK